MKNRSRSFWDVIAWVVLILIVVWLILKLLGVINTPDWLEYSPIFGLVYLAGWGMHKLENISEDVRDLKKFKLETIKEINSLKNSP
ncbi:hypothetical protein CMI42_04790 [Candidatus Pacearchaeota archaeon]|nr:hypothetical protein [Candidatus Pacearchaeota archaeon]|tara:strand:+ start:117 stop:374 length:258 start_codon:yes stop_codon:yes gene_type:complete